MPDTKLLYALLPVLLTAVAVAGLPALVVAKPLVVATTTDLADFTRQVAGNKVEVFCLLRSGEDPHFVRPVPSAQRRVRDARLFVQTGLDLETWAPTLLEGARAPHLLVLTATKGVKVLEKLTGGVSPAQGDVHPAGNPHVFHSPTNAKLAVSNILGGLMAILPADTVYLKNRARAYIGAIDAKAAAWDKLMQPHRGAKVVAYHNTWVYLGDRYGLRFVGFVEPMPGIPPTPKHTASLAAKMKAESVRVIVTESYYPRQSADSLARQTGAKVIVLAGYPGSVRGTDTYVTMMDYNLRSLSAAL